MIVGALLAAIVAGPDGATQGAAQIWVSPLRLSVGERDGAYARSRSGGLGSHLFSRHGESQDEVRLQISQHICRTRMKSELCQYVGDRFRLLWTLKIEVWEGICCSV